MIGTVRTLSEDELCIDSQRWFFQFFLGLQIQVATKYSWCLRSNLLTGKTTNKFFVTRLNQYLPIFNNCCWNGFLSGKTGCECQWNVSALITWDNQRVKWSHQTEIALEVSLFTSCLCKIRWPVTEPSNQRSNRHVSFTCVQERKRCI